MIILVEGINGSGKTSLCNRLVEHYEDSVYIQEPGTTTLGTEVRSLLSRTNPTSLSSLFLYAAARAELVEKILKPLVQAGRTVILDRFNPSTIAYQGYGLGLDLESVKTACNIASQGFSTDRNILLVCPVKIASERAHKGNWTNSGGLYQDKVQRGYLEIAQTEKNWCVLDGTEEEDTVFASAVSYINDPEGMKIAGAGSFGVLKIW